MSKKHFFFALFFLAPPVVAWCQTAENTQKPSTYVVKKGDCLWNISKRVWGDPTKWPLLFATNETQIKNPNLIYPGQKFTIPTTITKEELKKATELAQERAVPLPAAKTGAEGRTLKALNQQETTTASNETAASQQPPSNTAPSGTENKENVVSPSNETPGTATSSGGSSRIWVLIAALLALGVGLFTWFRKRSGGVLAQQPRPLSSFPQAAEPPHLSTGPYPPIGNKPMGKPGLSQIETPSEGKASKNDMGQAGGQGSMNSVALGRDSGQRVVAPSQGAGASGGAKPGSAATPTPATPSAAKPAGNTLPPQPTGNLQPPTTPSTPPSARTGEFTGTITSISMSQPPVPSKAEPPTPAPSASPSSTPSTSPAPENKTPENPSGSSANNP